MKETRLLRKFVEELWARPDVAAHASSVLRLTSPWGSQLHVARNPITARVCMCYYVAQPDGTLVKELAVVFAVLASTAWAPIEFYRAQRGHHVYVQVDAATHAITLTDPVNQRACAAYCDCWSFHLRKQGWLEKGICHDNP